MNGPKDTKHSEIGRHEVWCDTENMISERCNCMASSYIDQIQDYDQIVAELRAEVELLNESLENERMRLAACGVAAMQNTKESRSERIDNSNPYWSASYRDVCRAVDSEIQHRETIATQARVIEIAKRVLNNAGLRPPDGGTPTVETICEDLDDAIKEIAAIEKEGAKDDANN